LDGRIVPYDGSPITLRCGSHVLRVGVKRRVRGVNLPCGRETTLR
jgi:hypothetical protein